MATLHFDVQVPLRTGAVRTAALGASASPSDRFASADVNKLVKLIGDSRYGLPSAGDDIEAQVVSIETTTVNQGYAQGSVQRFFVHLDAEVVGGPLAIGATVVCAAQNALGTPQTLARVQAGAGVLFRWRVISHAGGDGSVGSRVIIEPIQN